MNGDHLRWGRGLLDLGMYSLVCANGQRHPTLFRFGINVELIGHGV